MTFAFFSCVYEKKVVPLQAVQTISVRLSGKKNAQNTSLGIGYRVRNSPPTASCSSYCAIHPLGAQGGSDQRSPDSEREDRIRH